MDIDENIFIQDVHDGLTIKELVKKYNCSKSTIARIKRKLYCTVIPKMGVYVSCAFCGKQKKVKYSVYTEQANHFCNNSCSASYYNKFRVQDKHPNWVGVKALKYRDKAFRQLKVECALCGYATEVCLDVHHIDSNRLNNDISNLVILCPTCHREVHLGLKRL